MSNVDGTMLRVRQNQRNRNEKMSLENVVPELR